jgi:gliding motility-associated-like protein
MRIAIYGILAMEQAIPYSSHSTNLRSWAWLQVCLDAINTQQCNDQYCLPIQVIPVINIGVPTAFSPNGDNLNDILYVEGRANISLMTLRIFNRWGELVFETNDPQQGWDGTYRQSAQDMDAFAYTLVAQLVSGRQVTAQGNITLVR